MRGEDGFCARIRVKGLNPLFLTSGAFARDYAPNAQLDTYSEAGLDDRSSLPDLTRAQRIAAERAMDRRDRQGGGAAGGGPGARAARRARAPAFLMSDDDDAEGEGGAGGLLEGISTSRRRRQYDERMEDDDAEGVEEEVSFVERFFAMQVRRC